MQRDRMTKAAITRFIRCRSGASSIEYAVMVTFFAVAFIAVLGSIGTKISNVFTKIGGNLT